MGQWHTLWLEWISDHSSGKWPWRTVHCGATLLKCFTGRFSPYAAVSLWVLHQIESSPHRHTVPLRESVLWYCFDQNSEVIRRGWFQENFWNTARIEVSRTTFKLLNKQKKDIAWGFCKHLKAGNMGRLLCTIRAADSQPKNNHPVQPWVWRAAMVVSALSAQLYLELCLLSPGLNKEEKKPYGKWIYKVSLVKRIYQKIFALGCTFLI